jgi:hypothetical protein
MDRLFSFARSALRARARRLLLPLLFLPAVGFAGAEDPLLNSFNRSKNVARMNCGAQIECILPDGHVVQVSPHATDASETAALIMDDDTVSCTLPEGETNFIVKLPNTNLIHRLTFLNENAAARGELSVAVSNYRLPIGSLKWKEVEGTTVFSHKRMFDLSLLGVEAKFVKLRFRVEKGGRIAGIGLYGERSLEDFARRDLFLEHVDYTVRPENVRDRANFNFANLYARARVVHVSSGSFEAARRMIDDDPITSFQFAAGDLRPTVIIELSETQRLHRVSAVYDMQPGHLDVYILEGASADPANLDHLTPIASYNDSNGDGKAAVNFDPRGARYIALSWTPAKTTPPTGFRIAEIDAFGTVPLALVDSWTGPELFAANEIGARAAGGPDISNSLGALADPPVLTPVSP